MATPIKDSAWLEWIASLLGGTSRQKRAAAFPPDQYWCLLDELPLHLIPAGSLFTVPPDRTKKYILNPRASILPSGHIPAEFAERSELLQRFALQGPVAWISQTGTNSLLPFWLDSPLENSPAQVAVEGSVPSTLSDEDLSVLIAAGLLQSVDQADREREDWRDLITRNAEMFHERGYAPIRNLIHPFHVAALRRYFRYMLRHGRIDFGDEQCPQRYQVHNDSVARFFHEYLVKTVNTVVGEPVKPSYVYSACYMSGAELKKHTDREQCEFSITFCLDFSPEPGTHTSWPIKLDTPRSSVTVYQALGDGLVYRGTRVPHYRDTLPAGRTSTSIFFHYVPENFAGPLD
jgi:hypothetical protein